MYVVALCCILIWKYYGNVLSVHLAACASFGGDHNWKMVHTEFDLPLWWCSPGDRYLSQSQSDAFWIKICCTQSFIYTLWFNSGCFLSTCCPLVVSPVIIKEWAAYKGKSPQTPELVEALAFREWTCPNLKKLWLGKAVEDKNRRMRAFLACMRSDTPAMLNPTNVPTHLMVLCCVLRSVVPSGTTARERFYRVISDIFNFVLSPEDRKVFIDQYH